MKQRIIWTIVFLLCSNLPIIESTSAQFIIPAIDLECQSIHPSGNLKIDATNGSNASDYAECTVSNPNMYEEKIRIIIVSGPLNQQGPADFYVEANGEVDFQVIISCDCIAGENGTNETRDITIIAEVVEANGVPPPIYADSESNLLVDIILYEEVNETKMINSEKSDGDQSLIYAGSGSIVLLLLVMFIVSKKRK